MFTHACITHIHAQRKSRLSTNFPTRPENRIKRIITSRKYENTVYHDYQSVTPRSRNERGIGVDPSLFAVGLEKFGPRNGGRNQITERGLFASHPRTASRNIQTIPSLPPPPRPWKTESSRSTPSPECWTGTRQSARTTVATFTAYRYPPGFI